MKYEFDESVGYWLVMSARTYERAINDELAPQGITFRQSQVLGWLALEGNLAQVELAERLRIEPPALVELLDRMERMGWIRREGCPEDRRRKLVRPCPEAEVVWARIVTCARKVRAKATRGLSAEDLATLKRLLAMVRANLGKDEG